jgi:type IV secretory pathway VirB4 component
MTTGLREVARRIVDRHEGGSRQAERPPIRERYPRPARPERGLPFRRLAVPGERPGHRATTAHACAAYPFVAEGGLGANGVYVGADAYGGSFCYDPWQLYSRRVLSGPNMLIVGKIGSGKSALIKTLILRQMVFGRRAWVVDPKSEYELLCEALGVKPIALRPHGTVRLNPLTPRAGRDSQLSVLRAVSQAALARPLESQEDAALRVALDYLNATRAQDGREPILPEIVEIMLRPESSMAAELATAPAELADEGRQVALALQRLCKGDLAGMFDGQTTKGLDLDAPLVVLDVSALQDSQARGILITCAAAWQQATLMEMHARAKRRGEPGHKILQPLDEAWRVTAHTGIAEWLQQSFKLSRAYGVQNIIALHRLSDLSAAGASGSRELKIAEGLVADADTRVIYAQSADQLPGLRELLGLTETELEIVPKLRVGEALWQVGRREFLVQHRLSQLEKAITDTDARMSLSAEKVAES